MKAVLKGYRVSSYLNIALAAAVTIQLCLYVNRWSGEKFFSLYSTSEDGLYLVSLLILVGVVVFRHVYHNRLTRRAEAGQQQLEAMISMFGGVKHKLNNDMQVVLGNAELADILINAGGDVGKPIKNITDAANDAVERIEQLSVFGSTGYANPKPVDLNAVLREGMAKLAQDIPSIVSLRLELGKLGSRVIADRYLLSLSLAHLIRQATLSMRHGGEIVVRTRDAGFGCSSGQNFIVAEIYIVRALGHVLTREQESVSRASEVNHRMSADIDALQDGLKTTKALVERCGVHTVRLSRTGDESLFAMRFSTCADVQPDAATDDLLLSRLYS